MQVDPINAIGTRSAAHALQELSRQYQVTSKRIVENSNYLKKLGEYTAVSEPNRQRNTQFFKIMSQYLPGRDLIVAGGQTNDRR